MTLSPRESGVFITSIATSITINHEKIEHLGNILLDEIESGRLTTKNFSQNDIHPKSTDPKAIDWIFVVDTLNFCFWHYPSEPGWVVEGYTGYFALCAAINRAVKKGIDILNPKFYSTINEQQLNNILKGDTDVKIPLLTDRVKCLHEVGNVLLEKFDGTFENCVKQADKSAKNLLRIIVDNFECFRDEAIYKKKKVSFYKRAQILIGDIWSCFQNDGLGHFDDIHDITMFADYRVPQTLLYYKVITYSGELLEKLQNDTVLENGSEEEVEIRGFSIHAVELLKTYVTKKLKTPDINSILIDHFLWDFRRKHSDEIVELKLPFHKTYSIYY